MLGDYDTMWSTHGIGGNSSGYRCKDYGAKMENSGTLVMGLLIHLFEMHYFAIERFCSVVVVLQLKRGCENNIYNDINIWRAG